MATVLALPLYVTYHLELKSSNSQVERKGDSINHSTFGSNPHIPHVIKGPILYTISSIPTLTNESIPFEYPSTTNDFPSSGLDIPEPQPPYTVDGATPNTQVTNDNHTLTYVDKEFDTKPIIIISSACNSKIITTEPDYICDGSDDSSTIQEAVDNLPSSGGIATFLEGTYIIKDPITLTDNITIQGIPGHTVFDCSQIGSSVFTFSNDDGYSHNPTKVTEHVPNGSQMIIMEDASAYSVGDYVKLSDDTSIEIYKKGELLQIVSIDYQANRIITKEAVVHDYNRDNNVLIRSLTMCENISIRGIEFIGPGIETDYYLARAYLQRNLQVTDCKVKDFGITAFALTDCLYSEFTQNHFENIFRTGFGYSIALYNACQNITIKNNSFTVLGRHYVAIGGATGTHLYGGWSRDISITNNHFECSSEEAIDSHAPCFGPIEISSNTFDSCGKGIALTNAFSTITENYFRNCPTAILLNGPEKRSSNIKANTFENCTPYAVKINTDNTIMSDNILRGDGRIQPNANNLLIEGNSFIDYPPTANQPIYGGGNTDSNYCNWELRGNVFQDCQIGSVINVTNVDSVIIEDNFSLRSGNIYTQHSINTIIRNNVSIDCIDGIRCHNVLDTMLISANVIIGAEGIPLMIDGSTVPSAAITVQDNFFEGKLPVSLDDEAKNISWINNKSDVYTEQS
ncbi:MAG: hypothetical protein SVY53_00400 [Chloroflexota bacterium]|nr:hypothetical protein [Chloroflexota bacterium]